MFLPAEEERWTSRLTTVLVLLLFVFVSSVAGATELTLMHCWGGHRTAMVDEMLRQFEAEHPGVTVNATLIGSCSAPLQEAFLTAYMGGAPLTW